VSEKSKEIVNKIADVIIDNKKKLTKLDSAIGDGDHGINMARGFKKIKEKIDGNNYESDKDLMKDIAMTLISTVGGASGPLYGTAFLNVSKIVPDAEYDLDSAIEIGEAAVEGVQKRGKAEEGEKTMLDTLIPALRSLKESKENGDDLETALKKCKETAHEGMKNTIPMQATKGRASYLGKRSIGHQDPGATSSYMIIETIIDEAF
jgi:dihydroxyacetone kinase-like protein